MGPMTNPSFSSRSFSLLVTSATLLFGCSGPDSVGTPAADEAPIEGGELDSNDPAIGLLVYTDGNYCTASLIAPSVVLTAGHCVDQALEGFYTQGGTSKLLPGMTKHTIASKLAHPGYVAFGGCPNTTPDVALVRLSKPIAGVAPLAYARSGTKLPASGTTMSAIGYGAHHDDAGNEEIGIVRRRATEHFLEAQRFSVHVSRESGIVDHGDSGGPLLFSRSIVGTASCITDDFPVDYTAYYGRVDAAATWIDATLKSWR
jgi:hypothetical protein